MKKVKFSKSEYVNLINLIAMVISCVIYLLGDYYYADGKNSFWVSYMVITYACFANIWLVIFMPISNETFKKRWLTKKEKDISYLIYFCVSVLVFTIKFFTVNVEYRVDIVWMPILPFAISSFIWFLLRTFGPCTKEEDIKMFQMDVICENPFYYENAEQTLNAFGVGKTWYSERRYKRLCETYLKTAKEFSGKKSEEEIELLVRERLMMVNSRGSAIASVIAIVGYGLWFVLLPFGKFDYLAVVAGACQIYVVLTFARNMHDPLTPRESEK